MSALGNVLQGVKWGDVKWPLRPDRGLQHPYLRAVPLKDALPWNDVSAHFPLLDPGIDLDNTNLGCCTAENGCRRFQMDDYKATGVFRNLRHADIYRAANAAINGNPDADNGFELEQMVRFLMSAGIAKPDCVVTPVGLDEGAINQALAVAPLICGVYCVGIMPQDLNERGWADESQVEGAGWMLNAGGHCILLGGALHSNGRNVGVFKNGGWGHTGLLGEGMILATTYWIIRTAMTNPLLVTHPSGNTVGPNYERWLA